MLVVYLDEHIAGLGLAAIGEVFEVHQSRAGRLELDNPQGILPTDNVQVFIQHPDHEVCRVDIFNNFRLGKSHPYGFICFDRDVIR